MKDAELESENVPIVKKLGKANGKKPVIKKRKRRKTLKCRKKRRVNKKLQMKNQTKKMMKNIVGGKLKMPGVMVLLSGLLWDITECISLPNTFRITSR